MAFSVAIRGSGKKTTSDTTLTLTFDTAIAAGKHVLLLVRFPSAVGITSVADTRGNTWQVDLAPTNTNPGGGGNAAISCLLTTAIQVGDTVTITTNASVNNKVGVIFEVGGLASSNWFGAASGWVTNWATTRATNPTTVTPNVAGAILIAFSTSDAAETSYTPGSGFTRLPGITASGYSNFTSPTAMVEGQYREADGSSTYTPNATGGLNWFCNNVWVWYKPASGTTYTKTGAIVSAPATAGADQFTAAETGSVKSDSVIAGGENKTLNRTGKVISEGKVAGPWQTPISQKLGSIISALSASGADAAIHGRTNIIISNGSNLSGSAVKGTIYYVKNGGSDAADGLTDATAWATLSKVQATTFSPGDTIAFKKGSVFREEWSVGAGGSLNARVNYTTYGTGADPRITGMVVKSGFVLHSGSIYKITGYACPIDTYFVTQNGTRLLRKTSTAAMVAGSFYHDDAGDVLYVWMTDSSNPSTKTIEVSEHYNVVSVASRAYINFSSGIQIDGAGGQFGGSVKITGNSDYISFDSCTIKDAHYAGYWFLRATGDAAATASQMKLTNSTLGGCVIQNISVEGASGLLITGFVGSGNTVDGGGNSAEGQASVSIRYGSAPIWTQNEVKNFTGSFFWGGACYVDFTLNSTVTYNYHHDCTPNAMQFDDGSNSFFCAWNRFIQTPGVGDCVVFEAHIRSDGTSTFIHNTCYGGQSGLRFGPGSGSSKETGITIKNNIVSHQSFANINIDQSGSSAVASDDFDNDVDYNLYFKSGAAARFVTFDSNTDNGLAGWRTLTGWDAHSIEGDPLYTNAGSGDYTLQQTSPAKDAGVVISGVGQTYTGAAPDIGYYEIPFTTVQKTGAIVSALAGAGADQVTFSDSGVIISALVGSVADVVEHPETGAVISALSESGLGDAVVARSGSIQSALIASGADQYTAAETGTVVSEIKVAGDNESTRNRSGIIVSALVGSGADQFTASESGQIISEAKTAGADQVTASEAGTVKSDLSASGGSVEERNETGKIISHAVTSGMGQKNLAGKEGSIISETGVLGADGSTRNRSGAVQSEAKISGADQFTAAESGTVKSDVVASGADQFTSSEIGKVESGIVASGSDNEVRGEAGTITSSAQASGADASEHSETGKIASEAKASGVDAETRDKTGAVTTTASLDGVKQVVKTKAGIVIGAWYLSASDQVVFTENASLISQLVIGGDGSSISQSKTGTLVAMLVLSGKTPQRRIVLPNAEAVLISAGGQNQMMIDTDHEEVEILETDMEESHGLSASTFYPS